MVKALIIESSPNLKTSASRKITSLIVKKLKEKYPQLQITIRDLLNLNIPHLDTETTEIFVAKSDIEKGSVKLSNELIADLHNADFIVIASPMHNFGVTSLLKAWIDHVVRSGKTFAYGPNGPIGLLENKKAILVTAAAGIYSSGSMKEWDFMEPYLRHILNFIGITDIQIVRVEGTAIPDLANAAIPNAEQAVENLTL